MGSSEQSVQDEDVKSEQHHGTEIEKVLGYSARFDISEVREGLGVGRIRQTQATNDSERTEHQNHAGQSGTATPSAQLEIRHHIWMGQSVGTHRVRSPRRSLESG
jgi:hypothetical protein